MSIWVSTSQMRSGFQAFGFKNGRDVERCNCTYVRVAHTAGQPHKEESMV